jgi:hypothetical protein
MKDPQGTRLVGLFFLPPNVTRAAEEAAREVAKNAPEETAKATKR